MGEIHRLCGSWTRSGRTPWPVAAMGVPRHELPSWSRIQVVTAELATLLLPCDEPAGTGVTIGPATARPLRPEISLPVSDMSFGAISEKTKLALGWGARLAGTGISLGEDGMLPEVHDANRRYLYEPASGRFGWEPSIADRGPASTRTVGFAPRDSRPSPVVHNGGSTTRHSPCGTVSPIAMHRAILFLIADLATGAHVMPTGAGSTAEAPLQVQQPAAVVA